MVLVLININYNLQDNKTNLCLQSEMFYNLPDVLKDYCQYIFHRIVAVTLSELNNVCCYTTDINSHLWLPDRFPFDTKISRQPNLTIWQLNSSFIGKLYFVTQFLPRQFSLCNKPRTKHSNSTSYSWADTDVRIVWCVVSCLAGRTVAHIKILKHHH